MGGRSGDDREQYRNLSVSDPNILGLDGLSYHGKRERTNRAPDTDPDVRV